MSDAVVGYNDSTFGGHAYFVVTDASRVVVHMPSTLDLGQAAALLEGAHYSLNYLKAAQIDDHTKVLVNGATGAIGSAGVQIMHAIGADITATCRTQDMDLVRGLGARHVISYEDDDFTAVSEQFDLVLDAVGKSTFASCSPAARSWNLRVHGTGTKGADLPARRTGCLGRRSPLNKRTRCGSPARNPQSVRFTVVALTWISTSRGPGVGCGSSASSTTSGGP